MEAARKKSNPAASLTEDLLLEILRRLPVRSVCRFKCVSHSWYKLISNPDHRVPQTLAGFFYDSFNGERCPSRAHHFTNVTGKGVPFIYPSFSFLPVPSEEVFVIDSCNGLLLCRCNEPGPRHDGTRPFHYVVCNPVTKKWVMLLDSSRGANEARTARLGFDPKCGDNRCRYGGKDMEKIPVPDGPKDGPIHQTRGRLLYFDVDDYAWKLSVWILEDYGKNEWTMKYIISKLGLFGGKNPRFVIDYHVIAVHPECNLVFFVYGCDNWLMAYEMDRKEVHVIRKLGHDCGGPFGQYLPYVPLFVESLAE